MNKKLTIALPKGRVMAKSLEILGQAGLGLKLNDNERTLRHETADALIIEMRNADVPIYVELGVADIGIVGKDVLLEGSCNKGGDNKGGCNIYEPVDLGFAKCRMVLIRAKGDNSAIKRIASKYPNITQAHLYKKGLGVEIIKLSGNVELACLTGLANAVVDIVETGSTLKANNLIETEVLFYSSARLIVNRAALKTKQEKIRPLIEVLRKNCQSIKEIRM